MSLLNRETETKATKAATQTYYGNSITHSPAGGITASEFTDVKEGDIDRETGLPRCAFCRQAKPLRKDGCCDDYCTEQQHGWVPWGKVHPFDKASRGRQWLSIV